jgi:hypothetical protein
MARVGRLAGAMLVQTGAEFYLVGNTKRPCDFAAAGFERPPVIDAVQTPYLRLSPTRAVEVEPPYLSVALEGEALARMLADRLVVQRTGSTSERLWRLITEQGDEDDEPKAEVTDARWLCEIPAALWNIVRDTVLRCS